MIFPLYLIFDLNLNLTLNCKMRTFTSATFEIYNKVRLKSNFMK